MTNIIPIKRSYSWCLALLLYLNLPIAFAITPPTNLLPVTGTVFSDQTTSVTISWNAVTGAAGYLVRAEDNTDSSLRDPRNTRNAGYFLNIGDNLANSYKLRTINLPVKSGHSYTFWVHAITSSFSYSNASSFSSEVSTLFSVKKVQVGLFSIGDKIQTIKNTNVRAFGALTGTLLGVQNLNAIGTIVTGGAINSVDGFTWFQINFDNGVDGFAGQDNLKLYASTAICPVTSETKSCVIANGSGEQVRTCSGGVFSNYSACNVISCNSGYMALVNSCVAQATETSKSVSRLGFVWTFSESRPVGTFANGDPWVQGPVTITSITPNDTILGDSDHRNGSMINPIPDSQQGYTNQLINSGQVYNANNNIARRLPYIITSDSSIVSSQTPTGFINGGSIADKYAVLTVLMSQPAAGSFRPPYSGTDKRILGNKSQLNYTKLPKLAPVAGAIDLNTVASWYDAIQYNHYGSWDNTHTAARLQNPGYGRNVANWYSHGLLHLCLNYSNAQKEKLLINLIQHGIDNYGYISNNGSFYHDGGHQMGRKAVAILAAYMLDDALMLSAVSQPGIFQEDTQTFVVGQTDVGRSVYSGYSYDQSQVGMPEWGVRHYYEKQRDDSRWTNEGTPYRFVTGSAMLAGALFANMTGLRKTWNWEPYFLYTDKFWDLENGSRGSWNPSNLGETSNQVHIFVANMWEAYRNVAPPKVVPFP